MATRHVEPGLGYKFEFRGKGYSFPAVERGPSEGMFSVDYSAPSHYDPAYAKWGLSWNVEHKVVAPPPPSHDEHPPHRQLRSNTNKRGVDGNGQPKAKAPLVETQENSNLWPKYGGGNFVDLTLKVKVKQAARTLMAFRPEYLHGTTRLCGAHSMGCTIPFCTRILDAFRKAQAGTSTGWKWRKSGRRVATQIIY
ncbi:hypothetical protein C8R46DRAFT_1294394 [Mycena filopes]|nr:hypothetical protein C8R46DRAFT_1294394 [Mycena filopes]